MGEQVSYYAKLIELEEKLARNIITLDELEELKALIMQESKKDIKRSKISLIFNRLLTLLILLISVVMYFLDESYFSVIFFLVVGIYNVYSGTDLKLTMDRYAKSANSLIRIVDDFIKQAKEG